MSVSKKKKEKKTKPVPNKTAPFIMGKNIKTKKKKKKKPLNLTSYR